MTVTFVVVGGWIALNAALAVALLLRRRDRPERRSHSAGTASAHVGR